MLNKIILSNRRAILTIGLLINFNFVSAENIDLKSIDLKKDINSFEMKIDPKIYDSSSLIIKSALKNTLRQTNEPITTVSLDERYLMNESNKCFTFVSKYEKKYKLPKKSLLAIVLNETGRKYSNSKNFLEAMRSWPWAVRANDSNQSYYFVSKQEAVAFITKQLSRGNTNLDVGCAQINLKYHRDAFDSIHQAIEPEINIHYAAYLVAGHYHNSGRSWYKSIAYYHSKTKDIGTNYANKVLKILSKLNTKDNLSSISNTLSLQN